MVERAGPKSGAGRGLSLATRICNAQIICNNTLQRCSTRNSTEDYSFIDRNIIKKRDYRDCAAKVGNCEDFFRSNER